MKYYLYILQCDDKFFYVGITKDLKSRFVQHVSGKSKYTKRYSNIELVHKETYKNRHLAKKRELQIKGWSRDKKKALIEQDIEKLKALSNS